MCSLILVLKISHFFLENETFGKNESFDEKIIIKNERIQFLGNF